MNRKTSRQDAIFQEAVRVASPRMRVLLLRSRFLCDQIEAACRDKKKELAECLICKHQVLVAEMLDIAAKEQKRNGK